MKSTDWLVRWDIQSNQVVCTCCGAGQSLLDALRPFRHREGCENARPAAEFPWRDLGVWVKDVRRDLMANGAVEIVRAAAIGSLTEHSAANAPFE